MTDRDALAGLDDVGWARLRHAYGSAKDVPALLRTLRSASPEEHDGALGELYCNIFHQGSRYPAAAPAVPFLARLALDPATPTRVQIVGLLAALAIGFDETHLPYGVDIGSWRAEVGRLGSLSPAEARREMVAWVEAAEDEAGRLSRGRHLDLYNPAETLRMARAELAAYDAVQAELPALRSLLRDDDPWLRAATAYLLGWFPEQAAGSRTALRALLGSETVNSVIANAFISAGLLSDAGLVPALREHLVGDEPLLRPAAAVALARLGVVEPDVIDALAEEASSPPPGPGDTIGVHFLEGDLRAHAAWTLASPPAPAEPASPAPLTSLTDPPADAAVDGVLTGLSRSEETTAFPMASTALRLTFPKGPLSPLPPFDELTGAQRRAVRILAGMSPDTWSWLNFVEIVEHWNLPGTQAGCRAYAGLDARG